MFRFIWCSLVKICSEKSIYNFIPQKFSTVSNYVSSDVLHAGKKKKLKILLRFKRDNTNNESILLYLCLIFTQFCVKMQACSNTLGWDVSLKPPEYIFLFLIPYMFHSSGKFLFHGMWCVKEVSLSQWSVTAHWHLDKSYCSIIHESGDRWLTNSFNI